MALQNLKNADGAHLRRSNNAMPQTYHQAGSLGMEAAKAPEFLDVPLECMIEVSQPTVLKHSMRIRNIDIFLFAARRASPPFAALRLSEIISPE
jgi:hypothetical protein